MTCPIVTHPTRNGRCGRWLRRALTHNYAISQCNLNHWRACLLFVRWICQIANCQSRQAPLENWLRLSNLGRITKAGDRGRWPGKFLDRLFEKLQPLFAPYISAAALASAAASGNPTATILQVYTWERDRVLTLAKGVGGGAVTVLAGLISSAVEEKIIRSIAALLAAALVATLLLWGGFSLTRLRRLADQYAEALRLIR